MQVIAFVAAIIAIALFIADALKVTGRSLIAAGLAFFVLAVVLQWVLQNGSTVIVH